MPTVRDIVGLIPAAGIARRLGELWQASAQEDHWRRDRDRLLLDRNVIEVHSAVVGTNLR